MSGAEREVLREEWARWFHVEFGGPYCVHPSNSRAQCEAWADQVLRTSPTAALLDLRERVESVIRKWEGPPLETRSMSLVLRDLRALVRPDAAQAGGGS